MLLVSSLVSADTIRYRGQYTYGHEVNNFCPEISSQCYWLSSEVTPEIRQQLKQLVFDNTSAPYEEICIVVEGAINRNAEDKRRIGFAENYDGLFKVESVLGLCGVENIVTQGDLQHHRWLLESINDVALDEKELHKRPELDFGERMTVTGNTGCNHFSGHALLEEGSFYITNMRSTRMFCRDGQGTLETLLTNVLSHGAEIFLDQKKNLELRTEKYKLIFRLKDWLR